MKPEPHPANWPFKTYKGEPYRPPKFDPSRLPDAPL
jgi:hypothetical protein